MTESEKQLLTQLFAAQLTAREHDMHQSVEKTMAEISRCLSSARFIFFEVKRARQLSVRKWFCDLLDEIGFGDT